MLDRIGLEVETHFAGHSILRKGNYKLFRRGKYCNFEIIKRGRTSLINQASANSSAALSKHYFTSRKANTATKGIQFDTDPSLHLAVNRTSLAGPAGCPAMQGVPSPRALQQKRPMESRLIP